MRASADLVIVGGGIIGCAAAWYAARAGLGVVLVERGGIACETTGAGMGHLMVQPRPQPLLALTRESVRMWKALHAELGDFALAATGILWLAEDAEDLRALTACAQDFATQGESVEMLTPEELRAREPALAPDLAGGLACAADAVVVPMQAAGALLRAARRHGAEVQTHTTALALERGDRNQVEAVRTSRGRIATRAVVAAAGVFTPAFAALAGLPGLAIVPRRGDLAVTAPETCPIRHQLLEVRYLQAAAPSGAGPDPGTCALNVQPQSRGTCLIGSTRQFAGFAKAVAPALLRRSLQRAARFIPALLAAPIARTWAGLRPATPDRLPLVAAVPDVPGLFVAAGHEGLGITLAPFTGALVAQLVQGAAVPPLARALGWRAAVLA